MQPFKNGNVLIAQKWACSSAGEHYVDIVGVTGSIPVPPTIHLHFGTPNQAFNGAVRIDKDPPVCIKHRHLPVLRAGLIFITALFDAAALTVGAEGAEIRRGRQRLMLE